MGVVIGLPRARGSGPGRPTIATAFARAGGLTPEPKYHP